MRAKLIKDCNSCSYRDHSGAFTPGGAKPICRGVPSGRRELPWNAVRDTRTGDTVRSDTGVPPKWCPLKQVVEVEVIRAALAKAMSDPAPFAMRAAVFMDITLPALLSEEVKS